LNLHTIITSHWRQSKYPRFEHSSFQGEHLCNSSTFSTIWQYFRCPNQREESNKLVIGLGNNNKHKQVMGRKGRCCSRNRSPSQIWNDMKTKMTQQN